MASRQSPPPTPNLPFFGRGISRPADDGGHKRSVSASRPDLAPYDDRRGDGPSRPSSRPGSARVSLNRPRSASGLSARSGGSMDRGKGKARYSDDDGTDDDEDLHGLGLGIDTHSPHGDAADTEDMPYSEFEEDDEEDLEFDELEELVTGSGSEAGSSEPLVRRRRRKWDDEAGDASIWELIPPLLLAHPLALFPALSAVPHDFLPAGVALFVPLFCILSLLSVAAQIVIVYLAWYLKVSSFEDVFAACAGERFGRYGQAVGRGFVLIATMGASVGWLGAVVPLLHPVTETYLPAGFLQSRILWTILGALTIVPALMPSRTLRGLRGTPIVLALLLPIITFIAIGRTSEIRKAIDAGTWPAGPGGDGGVTSSVIATMTETLSATATLVSTTVGVAAPTATDVATSVAQATATATAAVAATETATAAADVAARALPHLPRGLRAETAGSGLAALTMFFTPHLQTLPIHAQLARDQRQRFPIPILAVAIIYLVLGLPFALVPYYLLDPAPGVFAQLPAWDHWSNVGRVLMAAVVLGSLTLWLLRGRDSVLAALAVERGAERTKAGRWVGLGMWAVVLALACIGGWLADKVELLGVMATLAVGWLLPSVFFIITFHVRSPLAIIFPSHAPAPNIDDDAVMPARSLRSGDTTPGTSMGHMRTSSLQDPAMDVLLARKERQLQKRRLGRRLWQDMLVYLGILPVGCISLAWCVGAFVGLW